MFYERKRLIKVFLSTVRLNNVGNLDLSTTAMSPVRIFAQNKRTLLYNKLWKS